MLWSIPCKVYCDPDCTSWLLVPLSLQLPWQGEAAPGTPSFNWKLRNGYQWGRHSSARSPCLTSPISEQQWFRGTVNTATRLNQHQMLKKMSISSAACHALCTPDTRQSSRCDFIPWHSHRLPWEAGEEGSWHTKVKSDTGLSNSSTRRKNLWGLILYWFSSSHNC